MTEIWCYKYHSSQEKHKKVGRLFVELIDTGHCLSGPLILYRYIFWKAKYIPHSFVYFKISISLVTDFLPISC